MTLERNHPAGTKPSQENTGFGFDLLCCGHCHSTAQVARDQFCQCKTPLCLLGADCNPSVLKAVRQIMPVLFTFQHCRNAVQHVGQVSCVLRSEQAEDVRPHACCQIIQGPWISTAPQECCFGSHKLSTYAQRPTSDDFTFACQGLMHQPFQAWCEHNVCCCRSTKDQQRQSKLEFRVIPAAPLLQVRFQDALWRLSFMRSPFTAARSGHISMEAVFNCAHCELRVWLLSHRSLCLRTQLHIARSMCRRGLSDGLMDAGGVEGLTNICSRGSAGGGQAAADQSRRASV